MNSNKLAGLIAASATAIALSNAAVAAEGAGADSYYEANSCKAADANTCKGDANSCKAEDANKCKGDANSCKAEDANKCKGDANSCKGDAESKEDANKCKGDAESKEDASSCKASGGCGATGFKQIASL